MHDEKLCTTIITLMILLTVPSSFSTDNANTASNTNNKSNISSNVVHVQYLDIPTISGAFDTLYFIEHLSWQPTSIRDVIGMDIINQLQPWLWAGAGDRKYETVTTFVAVHCCREAREGDSLETEDPAKRNAECTLPPTKEQRKGDEGQMSLWVLLSDQTELKGCVAMAHMTRTIGKVVNTPKFLKDFDLHAVDWEQSGLVYLPPDIAVAISSSSTLASAEKTQHTPGRFVCIVEGTGNSFVSKPKDAKSTSEVPMQFEGLYSAGECIYAPTGWLVSLEPTTHTTSLLLTWPDDVIITEEFLELLESDVGSSSSPTSRATEGGQAKDNNETFLDLFLTQEDDFEKENLKKLWLNPSVLPHFLRYYYFSTNAPLTTQKFLEKIKPDSMLLPNLVDCPAQSECHFVLLALLRVLDLDGDGQLGPLDLANLTHENLPALQLHVDDLVQEIRDLALDQWHEAMEASPAKWEEFAERASEKRKESARAVAKRIQDRELSLEELDILKESLPELYEQLEEVISLTEEEDDAENSRDEL